MAIDLGDIPTGTPPTAGEKLQIRSAIGVGTTDAPTFLAQTLTGQSLTGTQATSLVDLATTWNTTGNPSLIYGRVTNTNSGTTANLIDLGTFAGGSLFSVSKAGNITIPYSGSRVFNNASGANGFRLLAGPFGGDCLTIERGDFSPMAMITDTGFKCIAQIGFIPNIGVSTPDTFLVRDGAAGILAQRNGTAKQALRVYNTNLIGAPEWAEFDWITSGIGNTLRIGTNLSGTGAARPIEFVTGGVARMSIAATGAITFISNVNFSADIRSTAISNAGGSQIMWQFVSDTTGTSTYAAGGSAPLMRFGGTTSAFPAIKRNGTGIHIVLADDSAFAPLGAGAVTATNLVTGNGLGGGSGLTFASQLRVMSSADGVMYVSNNGFTDFNRLQLGSTADTHPAIARDGAGIKITGAATGSTSWIKVPAVAVSALPSAATAGVGARSFVNDALAPTFGSAVTGGGAVTVPVYSTGSAWNVG